MFDFISKMIMRHLFHQDGTIRIDPNHLPGLTPPKAAPPLPYSRLDNTPLPTGPTVEELYEHFVRTPRACPKRPRKPKGDLF